MSKLDMIGQARVEKKSPRIGFVLTILFFIFLILAVTSSAAYIAYKALQTTTTSTTSTTTSSTTTTTSSTTSSTTTSTSSTSTTTSTVYIPTTTTTLCGGYFEPACDTAEKCASGYTLNSEDYCVPYNCGEAVKSGRDGCGEWALTSPDDWCKIEGYRPGLRI
ncbi:MAG: hypothetical protein KKD39_03985 [Candidatus Altiarchaeota archaeon]|nr:hypothetical protein [Candidatus Altiarchaeota archaeon]